jgi:hypothetical protein
MNAFYEFLMQDLHTIKEVFEDDYEIAEEICTLLSVDGSPIPEIFWRLYICKVNIDFSKFMGVTSYFVGAGLLQITCDCSNEDSFLCEIPAFDKNSLFEVGKIDRDTMSDNFIKVTNNIESLRMEMLS